MLRFAGFKGARKARHPLDLPPNVGVQSLNQRPGRGDLRPWRQPLTVASAGASTQSIYRMGRDVASDSSYWLTWNSADVDVVRGFITDDAAERTYFTGDGAPKLTDAAMGLLAPPYPSLARVLGVPAPVTVPTVATQVAGTGTVAGRYYVWTWVTASSEESAPSLPSTLYNAPSDSTARVTFGEPVPTGRDINRKRLYATQTGASGASDFYFVVEVDATTAYFDDTGSGRVEPLPSLTWLTPPAGLRGLTPLWGGIMAGFVGKSIRFCEPYRPFAWPLDYELKVDDTMVALAVWGQNLLALTTGQPHLINGADPSSMSIAPVDFKQACASKRSVVGLGHGVAWAAPDGLAYVGNSGPKLTTADLFLRDDWQALNPSSFIAAEYEGAYFASYDNGGGRKGLFFDPLQPEGAYFLSQGWRAAFADPLTDALYIVRDNNILKWDADAATMTTEWWSRPELTAPTNYAWGRVIADGFPLTVTFVADGVIRLIKTVTSGAPFRLPAGFMAEQWQVRVSTQHPMQAVLMSNDAREIALAPP